MTTSIAQPHRIAIAGASGRMGQMLAQAVTDAVDCQLAGALDVADSVFIGNDATGFLGQASGVVIQSDLQVGLNSAQVLIDFTRPEGTMAHIKVCRELGVKMVIGTTGFSDAQKADISAASQDIAIVMAPNMSVGVNVTLKLLEMAAVALATDYDIEITHKSSSRSTYAEGSLRAARFLAGQQRGLFDMFDVLGLRNAQA